MMMRSDHLLEWECAVIRYEQPGNPVGYWSSAARPAGTRRRDRRRAIPGFTSEGRDA